MSRSLLLLLVCGCTAVHSDDKVKPAATPAPPPVTPTVIPTVTTEAPKSCVDDAKPFDPEVLRTRLEVLASPEWDGRAPGTEGDKAARALIVERFRCLGLAPAADGDGYEQAVKGNDGSATANVVGMIEGSSKPDEIVIVGAHHDHLGGGFLGANDNASGVVGLLAIAQSVAQRETKPARTIVFVTFGAEEQGLIGSLYFVANPPKSVPLANVVQYINLDMIGSHASKNGVAAFGAFTKQPSKKLLEKLDDKFPKVSLGIGGHSVRGDHINFCAKKIPYIFFWTPDKRCYHEKCDTADKIDYARMADIAQIAGGLAVGLADTETDLVASKKKIGCFGR
ncbi:MAG: M20/M25/M40 family metallo-hydrolase [Myxococcota bacterium]|nr:M20/M25/M40 family metallo-hydrolase [Myxococcota bacterium]